MYTESYDHLWVISLTPEQHERTCDYWFTVTSHATAHTAFNRRESLMNWLSERGLSIGQPPPYHVFSTQKVKGSYRRCSHMNRAEFDHLQNVVVVSREMSNGDYTACKITQDKDGIRTVHYLNPNVHERVVYDYFQSRELYG